jgi:hypothetical protein
MAQVPKQRTPAYDRAPRYVWDRPKGVFTVFVYPLNPELWQEFFNLTPLFLERYKDLFLQCVFESHRYLIRVTPIITGRLRAGWTSILDKYNQDYTMAFYDTSLVTSKVENLSAEAIAEGKTLSTFQDQYPTQLDITITNQVFYGEYVEWGTNHQEAQYFVDRAMYKAEYILSHNIDAWINDMSNAGKVVEPKPVEEVIA